MLPCCPFLDRIQFVFFLFWHSLFSMSTILIHIPFHLWCSYIHFFSLYIFSRFNFFSLRVYCVCCCWFFLFMLFFIRIKILYKNIFCALFIHLVACFFHFIVVLSRSIAFPCTICIFFLSTYLSLISLPSSYHLFITSFLYSNYYIMLYFIPSSYIGTYSFSMVCLHYIVKEYSVLLLYF